MFPNTHFKTQWSYPQQPSPTYDANHHRPTVLVPSLWTLPTATQYQGPSINSPTDSLGPSLLWRVHLTRMTQKCASPRTILEIMFHAVYACLLFGLPMLYTSRVSKISEQVDASMGRVKKSVLEMSAQTQPNNQNLGLMGFASFDSRNAPLLHGDLKYAWDSFIDSMMNDWKMLNVISIVLLSGIVGILQIQSAADDPFTRFSGLLSLICVFISVSCGCMYSIRFDSIRETHKAVEWSLEAQNTKTSSFWNVHILLAIPLIWLAWSILLYLICFLSFLWRTGTILNSKSPPTVTTHDILCPRIIISAIIALGFTCFILIFTTFRRYDEAMDHAWSLRVKGWLLEAKSHTRQQGSRVKARRTNQ